MPKTKKLAVWQCTMCQEYNSIGLLDCSHCHQPQSSAARLIEIDAKTPAALELLSKAPKPAKKQAKRAKSGDLSKSSAKDKTYKPSSLEWQFLTLWQQSAYPMPKPEYRFHPTRRWRFDFAWPELKIAIELEGGVYSRGRHTRGKGYEQDCEKYNQAVLHGWRVLRFVRVDSSMIEIVETLFKQVKEKAA